jgi:UDP-2,3-diacylglucosamine pyrophosphatase LpxH
MTRRPGVFDLDPHRTAFSSSQSPPAPGSVAPGAAQPAVSKPVSRVRAIFISDVHLGTPGCKAAHLLDFLRHYESEYLYLVGDILDGWALRSRFYWHQTHNDVIQKVLRRARKGAHVTYVPGNHDEIARQFCGLRFGDVAISEEAVHTLLDGRRLWVVHGDLADGVIRHVKWLAHVGDRLYDWLLWANRHFNMVRAKLGFGYWSLSQYLKHKVKNAVSFISDFEHVLVREARRRGFDGVVCGHIHKAQIHTVDGLPYCNSGDWVESLTAIVETLDGQLQIVTWDSILAPGEAVPRWNDAETEEERQAHQPVAAT